MKKQNGVITITEREHELLKEEAVLRFQLQTQGQENEHLHRKIAFMNELEKEHRKALDEDVNSSISFIMNLKNELWMMEQQPEMVDVDKKDALTRYLAQMDSCYAEKYYNSVGWKRKFSGEWVRKE